MKNALRIIAAALLMTLACGARAQKAVTTDILDKAASAFKKAESVVAGFTIKADGRGGSGTIKLCGSKFVCAVGGNTVWFNGKTMWTYVKENEEVNVTTPSAAEVAKMNPYKFLTLYKSGYKAAKGNNTKEYYEIVLTPAAKGEYSKVVVRVNRHSYQLMYASMTSGKAVTTVSVTSYKKVKKLPDSTFTFSSKKYPDAEVIDLR